MKLKHLSYLCDPKNHQDLVLENAIINGDDIISGTLRSATNVYPIVNGIPRFVKDESYSDNFGYQWHRWASIQFDGKNIGRPMHLHTSNMFKTITGFSKKDLKDRVILDMGCGSGRFTDVAIEMGATVIALDYSSAIDAAKANFTSRNSNVLFLQADALQLPIKSDNLDYCFTIGVLHHTPSPMKGTQEAYRILKKKGQLAIRIYGAGGFYTYSMVRLWRKIFLILRPLFKFYPPLIYSYFFGTLSFLLAKIWKPLSYPLRAIFPTALLPDYRWTILDTFDAISTSFQSGHTPQEIEDWLKRAGFVNVVQRNNENNDFIGTK